MIATVRVAPLEHWCEGALTAVRINGADASKNVGMPVSFLPETMRKSKWCDGNAWTQEDRSIDEMRVKAGLLPRQYDLGPREICEHMLEMD